MNLMDILIRIAPKSTEHGHVILLSDILPVCKANRLDNHDLIETKLKELEQLKQLKVIYVNNDSDIGLIIGVKLCSKV